MARPDRSSLLDDRGSGPISAIFGVTIFLIFLMFAVQVTAHLFATSAVTAAAFDAARLVAAEQPITRDEAATHVRTLLGDYGAAQGSDGVQLDWAGSTADEVVLRVTGPSPAALVRGVSQLAGLGRIDRTVRVRIERVTP